MGDLITYLIAELFFISTFIWFSYWTFPIRGILSLCLLAIFKTFFPNHYYVAFIIYVIWYIINFIAILKIRKSYTNSTLILYAWYSFSSLVLHCIPYINSIDEVELSIHMISGFASILLFVDWHLLKYKNIIKSEKLLEVKSNLIDILNDSIDKYNIIESIYNSNIKTISLINLLEYCSNADNKNKIDNMFTGFYQNIYIPQQCLNDMLIESDSFNKLDYIIKLKSTYVDRINYIQPILSNIDRFEDWQIDNLYNKYCNQELLNK